VPCVRAKCKTCHSAYIRAWNAANPEKAKAISARKYAKNRAQDNARTAAYLAAHPEKKLAYGAAYRARNPEKERARAKKYRDSHKAEGLAYRQKYRAENKDLVTLWDANRRANEKRATPSWANQFFIAEAYHLAKLREQVCGGSWHVDHLVPLQSKRVCGLHVEHNLSVIPGPENMSKSNRYWPDMP
jgi:hypothetical protein